MINKLDLQYTLWNQNQSATMFGLMAQKSLKKNTDTYNYKRTIIVKCNDNKS